jgi:hypothetical protein
MKRFLVRQGADGELEKVAIRDRWCYDGSRVSASDLDENRRYTLAGVLKPQRKDKRT